MAGEMLYVRDDRTALITPDALRIRFKQSSFPVVATGRDELRIAEDVTMSLTVASGFVESVTVRPRFVDKRSRVNRACELLESMGWVRAR
jgi:hypothetical protein